MAAAHVLQVVIYDAPQVRAESCGCGCDGHHDHDQQDSGDPLERVNLELKAKALALTLEADFPGRVQVEYINVLEDPRGATLPQTALLCSRAYPTPLVYINGRGRFAGALPVERIREEVAKLLQPASELNL
jgi:hypothetical protein